MRGGGCLFGRIYNTFREKQIALLELLSFHTFSCTRSHNTSSKPFLCQCLPWIPPIRQLSRNPSHNTKPISRGTRSITPHMWAKSPSAVVLLSDWIESKLCRDDRLAGVITIQGELVSVKSTCISFAPRSRKLTPTNEITAPHRRTYLLPTNNAYFG